LSLLYQVPTTGGDEVPLQTSIPNPIIEDISPDRSELLVASCVGNEPDCPLWVLPVLGRSPRRLGEIAASFTTGPGTAAYFPDGKDVVYVQGNSLYRVKAEGTEGRKIVSVATGGNPTGFVGRPTEVACGSACRPKMARHSGKSPQTEEIFTHRIPSNPSHNDMPTLACGLIWVSIFQGAVPHSRTVDADLIHIWLRSA
jgi:hypothetical protein